MEIWKITHTKEPSFIKSVVPKDFTSITTKDYTELRNFNGELCRLGPNSTFSLEDTVLGKRPVIGGESYLKVNPSVGGPKYRTSCWGMPIHDSMMESFYKQLDEKTDHIYALKGTHIIFEYDDKNKPFVITSIEEGQKAVLNIAKTENIRDRYTAKIENIADEEYDYILHNFIDNRKWY
ncbi:hypothetical protein [Clostridium botulinum]|uniref:hypothetical protein n=1 Tax=Clostridium botulinum TaxID=1491 RepID=UPI00059E6C39|nr:hypothetical protein [Clostridium botulinum]KIN81892.1 hypothetical protein SD74_08135 [Clostridium botulinum]MCC5425558.1 hypothetical protein [Clostridium botulinum]